MRPRRSWAAWPLLPIVAFASWASAFHTVFDYEVERVDVDGGAHGLADGVPDYVDDFDDGVLGPGWNVLMGTGIERDGSLHLTNPGSHLPVGEGIDLSQVASTTTLYDGGGDFTITAAWTGDVREGDFVNLALYVTGGEAGGSEFFGAAVHNLGSETLLQQYWGEGLSVTEAPTHAFPAATAAEPFVMRIAFDDETNTALVSFSFDDGATYESFFDPVVVFRGRTDAVFVVGADPETAVAPNCCTDNCTRMLDTDQDGLCDGLDNCSDVPNTTQDDHDADGVGDACDVCLPTQGGIEWLSTRRVLKRVSDHIPDNERMRLRVALRLPADGQVDPAATGLKVQLPRLHYAPIELVMPAGDEWKVAKSGTRFTFMNGNDGSGQRVARAVVRQRPDGTVALQIVTARGAFQGIGPRVALSFPGTPGGCAQHVFGLESCQTEHTRFLCKD